jgi:hypothetical protein
MFRGEILIGIDLEGEEPGDDSKCILGIAVIAYRVGLSVYTLLRALSAVVFASVFVFFSSTSVSRQLKRGGTRLMMYDADVGDENRVAGPSGSVVMYRILIDLGEFAGFEVWGRRGG